ncbi:transposase [Xiashengella succiniciproducens]|mgnify:CR=1 FL=1|jgi:transposase-like protein
MICRESDSGIEVQTLRREHGIARTTLYSWRKKYSGMDVSL